MTAALDLFAGPGGWDVAARGLGLDPLGIEWDAAACATREAAGLRTMQADVSELATEAFECDLLIASPPCQAWSMAGKRGGERDKEHVVRCAHEIAAGDDTRAQHAKQCEDARSMLVVEPLRFIRDLAPPLVALEQVPPVLELWSLFAGFLSTWGYRTWTGILSAERYGVPQTRKRAILMASLDGPVAPPEPTHQAYVPGEAPQGEEGLFGAVLPWVSMAQALGWEGQIGFPRRADDGAATEDGYRERDFRDADEPAFNLTEKARSWQIRAGTRERDVSRDLDDYGGEIHNIMQVLAPDVLGDREEFGREWCGGYWSDKAIVADPAALGTYLRDEGLMLRRTRKEVGRELPEVVRVPHSIDTNEEVLEQLTGEAIDLARMIVERQAPKEDLWRASGDFDWKMRHATGVAKAGYVADFTKLLLETEEPVVLFGWHRDVYDIWAARLAGYNPLFYTGTESPAAKQRAKEAFLLGDSQLFIMSLRAGTGLDGLQDRAHVAVFGELDWSPGIHDQCIGRLHRDGQDDPVVAYFLLSEEGADPVMAEVLNLKRQQADAIRDPDAQLFTEAANTGDRVQRLAEDLLAKRAAQGRMAA